MNDNAAPGDWESQLIDYTMGVMEPEEAAAFEAGMEECRRNLQLARDYGVVTGLLGLSATASEPPEGHKSRLMSRVQATTQSGASGLAQTTDDRPPTTLNAQPPALPAPATPQEEGYRVADLDEYRARRAGAGWMQALLAAAAVVIILLAVWVWNLNNSLSTPNIPTGYTALSLPAQKGYEGVTALALYNPQKNDVILVADGLAQPPVGKVYELWFLKAQGNPEPAGTFSPDQSGSARHTASSAQTLSRYTGFAVSEEPTPGSPTPTGPIIAAGTYSTP